VSSLQVIDALRRAPAVTTAGPAMVRAVGIAFGSTRARGHRSGYEDRGECHSDGKQPEADRASSVRNSFVE
jgi:hypothetical protein